MSSTYYEDEPRRGFGLAVLGGALLVAMGLYGGWLVFGGTTPGGRRAELTGGSSSSAVGGSGKNDQVLQVPVLSATQGSGTAVLAQPAAGGGNGGGTAGHPLTVTAVFGGSLGPGSPAYLLVTVTNPNNQDVLLTDVSGAVTSVQSGTQAGKVPCSAGWYHVGSFTGSRTVTRNTSTTVTLPVTFDDAPTTNQDNCKGVRFNYSFSAQARQA